MARSSGRGGAGRGQGRKPRAIQNVQLSVSCGFLTLIDEVKEAHELFERAKKAKDDQLVFRILEFHHNQKYGKAVQRVWVGGDSAGDPVKVLLIGEKKKHG